HHPAGVPEAGALEPGLLSPGARIVMTSVPEPGPRAPEAPGDALAAAGVGVGSEGRSGRQFSLAGHGYEAQIASVGASLRTLTHQGGDLIVPFEADEVRPAYRGATLAPWPNRVVD